MAVLETERLILRPWRDSDAEWLYTLARDRRVGPIAGWPPHISVEYSRSVIHNMLSAEEHYAIVLKGFDHPIGCIALMYSDVSNIKIQSNEAEIGYWLGVPFWGRGFATEALKETVRHAFEDLDLDRLWCGYFEGNIPSKKVMERCGFRYRTTFRNIKWESMNDIRTEHIHSLSVQEWRDLCC